MKKRVIVLLFIFIFCSSLFAQVPDYGKRLMGAAITDFGKARYAEALLSCRDVILDPVLIDLHADAYFWISKSYLALGEYDDAEKNLEFYLLNYKGNDFYEEGLYQKGRLLYLQGEYESSIQIFYQFQLIYPGSIFISNSYFWIGESLFSLGHLNEAYVIFSMIVKTYPTSYKVEAASYRIKLIEQKDRENELLKLLKMSHEDNLKSLEDFQRREREYEQAITSYQKKISSLSSKPDTKIQKVEQLNAKIVELEIEYEQLEKEKQRYFEEAESNLKKLNNLQNELDLLKEALASMQSDLLKAQEEGAEIQTIEVPVYIDSDSGSAVNTELLTIKEEALELKEFYLNYLIGQLE